MIPTVTDVREWVPNGLQGPADATSNVESQLSGARDRIRATAKELWPAWRGIAANAAEDHLDNEDRAAKKVVEEIGNIASTLDLVDDALDFAFQAARNKITDAEEAGFVVSDDGVAEGVDFPGVADGAPDAAAHWSMIAEALSTIGSVDSENARRIQSCVSDLIDVTPKAATFTPDDAANDWSRLSDGTITREDLGRFRANLAATGIDPSMFTELAKGNTVTGLPAEVFTYFETFYATAGIDGILELEQQLANDGSPDSLRARDNLANGLMFLSNENVSDVNGVHGGWDRLPQNVRDLAELRAPGHRVPPTLPEYLDSLPAGVRAELESQPGRAAQAHRDALNNTDFAGYHATALRAADFWDFAGSGGAVPGAELGVNLVETAVFQITSAEETEALQPKPSYGTPFTETRPAESMLDLATNNRDVSMRILTGDLDGDGHPETQRDDLLAPLFTHTWDDGGESVGKLANWMTDEMSTARNEGDTARIDRAETSALALAQYLSHEENYDRSMDVHGENTSNVGEVNPHLVRGFANGLYGYVPELIQEDNSGAWARGDLEETDRFHHAQRVFTLMATDPESSATFGNAATTFTRAFAAEYADPSTISHTPAQMAGRLQALVDKGIYNVADEMFDDNKAREDFAQQRRADTYSTNYTVIRNLVALDPRLSATVGLLMDVNSNSLQSAFVPTFDDVESSPFTGEFSDYSALNSYFLLESAVAQHGLPQDSRALEGLDELGMVDSAGVVQYPGSDVSTAEITSASDNALRTFDVDLSDYRNYYLDGYGQIVPAVRDAPRETGPR
ncbi:TPR repeat region-containing protein [Rhodococcus yananensis]|uniref:TPR repeat region-containing protein n=1 Tax=Rhodococcus yananensis TaxID=2879464 RepID=UPI001CF8CBF0|nr:hypothetical protein [Rhodococcus yananensis]